MPINFILDNGWLPQNLTQFSVQNNASTIFKKKSEMNFCNHQKIEEKWKKMWDENEVYQVNIDLTKKKFYCLDMFPYPSGAGLHVGHPHGYIATDILCRFKRLQGYNVLHPMGFDSFGLPAEQYAIETGQHPAITTEKNITNFNRQLSKMGLSIDKKREIKTSSKEYYRWTQWIFCQLFNAWFDKNTQKAKHIDELIAHFLINGSKEINAEKNSFSQPFTAEEWKNFSAKEKSERLMDYRLAYLSYAPVNWCPTLGTVLANDEIENGLSKRGGYSVEKKEMKQWMMRITAYAQRLLENLGSM